MLADIETTTGTMLAKIIRETDQTYFVKYMSLGKKGFYRYESEETEIDKECVAGFYNPEDTELAAGFKKVEGGYLLIDEISDDDYEPSEEAESDSDISLDEELESDSEEAWIGMSISSSIVSIKEFQNQVMNLIF